MFEKVIDKIVRLNQYLTNTYQHLTNTYMIIPYLFDPLLILILTDFLIQIKIYVDG